MLSTGLSTVMALSALVIAITLAVYVHRLHGFVRAALDYSRQSYEFVSKHNEKSLSLARIAELDGAVTELTDSYSQLLASHKKLRSRIGMRELRERRKDLPPERDDVQSDDVAKARRKAELRVQAKQMGFKI